LINGKWVKQVDNPHPLYFFVSKKLGVAGSWLRRWRYRMYLHRASFLHEGVLLRLLDPTVQARVRVQLARTWGREILWRRSADAEPVVRERLASQLLALPLEKLLEVNWCWYEPMMFQRLGPRQNSSFAFKISRASSIAAILKLNLKTSRFLSSHPWEAVDTTPHLRRPSRHLRNRWQRAVAQAHLWTAACGSCLLSSYRKISFASLLPQPSWQGNLMSFPCITKRFTLASESWRRRNCFSPLEKGFVRRI